MSAPDPAQVQAMLDKLRDEAIELRFTVPAGKLDHPDGLMAALSDVRARIDRVDEILADVLDKRNVIRRIAEAAKLEATDAYDEAMVNSRRNSDEQYLSAAERQAMASQATIELQLKARQRADLRGRFEDALELIRHAHRGLTDYRQELLTRSRLLVFESHLDR